MRSGTKKLDSLKTQRIAAGHSVETLARKACVSDLTIVRLEAGGNDDPHVCQRLADALGVSLATLGEKVM